MKSEKIPILIPTFHKMELLLEPSIELLKYTWPSHGPIFSFSDDIYNGHIKNTAKTYRFSRNLSWIDILYRGIRKFNIDYPDVSIVYLILDDLLPIRLLDEKRLSAIEKSFKENNWDYLYFPHYDNNYTFDICNNKEFFCKTKKSYKYYTQIGAGLIKVDYLIQLCELALTEKIYSPWQFEFLISDADHYITKYRWPSVRDGFSKSKFINKDAIKMLDYPEGKFLQKKLQLQARREILRKFVRWIIQKQKNISHRLKHSQFRCF